MCTCEDARCVTPEMIHLHLLESFNQERYDARFGAGTYEQDLATLRRAAGVSED